MQSKCASSTVSPPPPAPYCVETPEEARINHGTDRIPQAPTLNTRAATASSSADSGSGGSGASSVAMEKLLMRWIPRPSVSNVFVGDVIAFNSPLSPPAQDTQASLCACFSDVIATHRKCGLAEGNLCLIAQAVNSAADQFSVAELPCGVRHQCLSYSEQCRRRAQTRLAASTGSLAAVRTKMQCDETSAYVVRTDIAATLCAAERAGQEDRGGGGC